MCNECVPGSGVGAGSHPARPADLMPTVVLIGTLDTKGQEYAFLPTASASTACDVLLVDAGVLGEPSIAAGRRRARRSRAAAGADVARARRRGRPRRGRRGDGAGRGGGRRSGCTPRGGSTGVAALGGSGGSSIATQAMRELPVGVPKLMVSTVASGDTRPYVGAVDVTMMYSVVDIAGINQVSARILANAAGAIAGMAKATAPPLGAGDARWSPRRCSASRRPCVTTARERLEELGYEVLVFHATGTGGQSMEALMRGGFVTGVARRDDDGARATSSSAACSRPGPTGSRPPARSGSRRSSRSVRSTWSTSARGTRFRERFEGRNLYVHNPTVTLMRTTPEECAELGRRIARKLNAATGPDGALRPAARRVDDRRRGPAVPRPGGRRGARSALCASTSTRSVEVHELDARRQRPGVRARDGGPAARDDRARDGETPDGDRSTVTASGGDSDPETGDMTRGEALDAPASRLEALERLRAQVAAGRPIIGAGAGTGLSAKCAEAGGADLIIIYNSGRYRMAGRGSLAGPDAVRRRERDRRRDGGRGAADRPGDAGAGRRVRHRPVPAACPSSCASSRRLGFAGVQNFPTVGLIDGVFRQNLEETGMGYALEVEMIRDGARARSAHRARTFSRRARRGRWRRPAPTSSSRTWA